ncbi:putative RNA-directed DNA polymerase from transposon BS [Trichonephila clavipes]|nr:putative RNA-directed DNA polymerase from transposon BS [Trichonephila clavipes]
MSKGFKLSLGLPQGSVLSPTLFILSLCRIEEVISSRCEIGLLADDIVIWKSGADISILENSINHTLVGAWNFAESHKLCFNALKSSTSFFTTHRKLYKLQPKIFLGGSLLSMERHPKYLGFVLDPEISSSRHIDHLVDKSRKRLNILKYLSGRDWSADSSPFRNTYLALIRPILDAIKHISNWHEVGDNTGVAILEKLKRLSSSREVHLQWIPLHVNIADNEIADSLAKDGAAQPTIKSAPLTYSELHSTYINNKQSIVSPDHHWYEAKRSSGSFSLQCRRKEQAILTRFRSHHLRTLTFRDGNSQLVLGVLPARHLQNTFLTAWGFQNKIFMKTLKWTATAGSDVVQSGRPIFDDFFQHLWPYIGNNTANVVFQMVKRLWLIRIDQ